MFSRPRFLAACLVSLLALAWCVPALADPTVQLGARINQELSWRLKDASRTKNQQDDILSSSPGLAGNSYLRASFASEDKVTGALLELGFKSATAITTRRAFGWYKVGSLTFMAGQDDNWQGGEGVYWTSQKLSTDRYNTTSDEQSEAIGWGKAWVPASPSCRSPGERRLGFQFALEKPQSLLASGQSLTSAAVYNLWPSLSLAFNYTAEHFQVTPAFIWTRWQIEGRPSGFDDEVDAYGFILPVAVKFAGFKLILEGHVAQNAASLYDNHNLAAKAGVYADGPFFRQNGSLENSQLLGGYAELTTSSGELRAARAPGWSSPRTTP